MANNKLIGKIFLEGKNNGFEEMEIYYSKGRNFSVKIYNGEIDSYNISQNEGMSFRGKNKEKIGYSYTEKVDESSVSVIIKESRQNAEIIESDDKEYIYEGAKKYREVNNYNPELEKVKEKEKIDFVLKLEEEAFKADKRIYSVQYCIYGDSSGEVSLNNTYGLSLNSKGNVAYAYLAVLAKEGEDIKSGTAYKVTNDFKSLNAKKIAKEAVKEAIEMLGAKSVKSGIYDIILKNNVVGDLLESYIEIFSAEKVQNNLSLLKGKIYEKIGTEKLTIIDNPFMKSGFASSSFDGEGYPCLKKTIVEHGILKTFLHNLKTSKKDGVISTGNASRGSYKSTIGILPSNLYIKKGEKSFVEILNLLKNGILITEIQGLHAGINTISGDFSLSANGFIVKNGKKATPVNQITISGNILDLLNNIEEIGKDLKFGMPGEMYVGSPSILIKNIDIAGE